MAQAAGPSQGPAPLTVPFTHQAFPKGGQQGSTTLVVLTSQSLEITTVLGPSSKSHGRVPLDGVTQSALRQSS